MRKNDRFIVHVFPMRVVTIFDFESRGRMEIVESAKSLVSSGYTRQGRFELSINSTASMPALLATVRKYYTCVARTFFSYL